MKRLRIYIDTSVIGGCLDPEFEQASNRLFDAFRTGASIAIVRIRRYNVVNRARGYGALEIRSPLEIQDVR